MHYSTPGIATHRPPRLPEFPHAAPNLSLYHPTPRIALGYIALISATRNMYGGVNKRDGNGKLAIRRMKLPRSWDSMGEL